MKRRWSYWPVPRTSRRSGRCSPPRGRFSRADGSARGPRRGALSGRGHTAATCFSMLHHMPSAEHQDRLFAELHRVLRPGGIFVGADSRDLEVIRAGHVDDTFVPVDPDTLGNRLKGFGFGDTTIDVGDYQFRFVSRKPGA
ncbi:MAG: class I SAM-dependent methyltransferase [Acidimicrobiales bacterium]